MGKYWQLTTTYYSFCGSERRQWHFQQTVSSAKTAGQVTTEQGPSPLHNGGILST